MSERFQFGHYTRQHVIGQAFEFFPRGRLYLDDIAIHEAARV